MNTEEQRQLGQSIAAKLDATKTQSIVGDETSSFEKIFTTAITELSVDDIVANVLQGPAEWACYALRYVPNLSAQDRDALIQKSAEEPLAALNTLRFVPDLGSHSDVLAQAAGALAQVQGEISGFYLNNKGSYNCEFTMYWTNNGKIQPAAGSGSSGYKWSSKLMVGQATHMNCSDFQLPKSPLAAGNEVWMYLWVQAGQDIQSPLRFTYNPNTSDYAWFTSSGCTQNDSLALEKIATPPAADAAKATST